MKTLAHILRVTLLTLSCAAFVATIAAWIYTKNIAHYCVPWHANIVGRHVEVISRVIAFNNSRLLLRFDHADCDLKGEGDQFAKHLAYGSIQTVYGLHGEITPGWHETDPAYAPFRGIYFDGIWPPWGWKVQFLGFRADWDSGVEARQLRMRGVRGSRAEWLHLEIPLWLIAALAASYPFVFTWKRMRSARQRSRRAKAHLCQTCSYDLRAHNPGEKCPECGTPIVSPITQDNSL